MSDLPGQRTLFGDEPTAEPARARKRDPTTSKDAAARSNKSGDAETQARKVLAFLEANDRGEGWTSAEVWKAADLRDRYVASRRLPALEKRERVVRIASRECQVNGTPAIAWRAASCVELNG